MHRFVAKMDLPLIVTNTTAMGLAKLILVAQVMHIAQPTTPMA